MKIFITALLFAISAHSATLNTCFKDVLGGGEAFPWSFAEPFPWDKIQGVWKVYNNSDLLMQFRVTNKKNRRLLVQIYSRENCDVPVYKASGVVSDTEPNVVTTLVDGKFMKLAWFNVESLKMNPFSCGDFVMAASLRDSSEDKQTPGIDPALPDESPEQKFLLKKISPSLEIYCKRRI